MKLVQVPIEYCAFLTDPNNPSRAADYHITVATYLDMGDGSPLQEMQGKRRALTPAQCKAEGIEVPDVAKAFDTMNARAVETITAELDAVRKEIDAVVAQRDEFAGQLTQLYKQLGVTVQQD